MKSRRQSGRGGAMLPDGGCSGKMERKDVEKNRRLHMKGLCLKLSSLLPASSAHHLRHYSSTSSSPPSSNKDAATQLDQLDSAAAYIKQLRARIEDLKRRKQAALSGNTVGCSSSVSAGDYKSQTAALPVIEVRHQDGTLDVALASEAGRPFRLHEVMAVLEQEGAEVVSASFSVVGDKIFYTLHSQALCPRIGLDAGRVAQRLRGLAAAATVSTLLT
uniref:BHLH domain-containing protein n=1 Tax=Aegilops tauschii subsp. strangulata TaxID=200361 RepID=A0A453DN33_AEGTS